MSKTKPPKTFDDNPEWTKADFAKAKRADQVHGAEAAALLVKRPRGRPAGSDKEQVTLRIDRDVLAAFRSSGAGWQTRINDALRKAAAKARA